MGQMTSERREHANILTNFHPKLKNVSKMSWNPILLFCQSSNNNKVVDAKFIALISHPTIVFAMLLAIPSTIHHLKGVFKMCFAYLKCKQEFNFIGQKTNVNVLSYILLHQFLQHGWKTWRTHCQGSQGTEGLEKKSPKNNATMECAMRRGTKPLSDTRSHFGNAALRLHIV